MRLGQSTLDDVQRAQEARRILIDLGLRDHLSEMDSRTSRFVEQMLERLEEYGDSAYISPAQLFWLRDLKDRHV